MVDVLVLGPIAARVEGASIPVGSPTQRMLLAAMAHARGRPVPVARLVSLVWDDDPPEDARSALKSHVSRLRRTLRSDIIAARPPGYALTVAPGQLDVHRFEEGVREARSVEELDAALALWRGPPYGELADHEHFAGEVMRLEEVHAQSRLRRAYLLRTAGQPEEAVAAYKGLVAEDPLREPAWIGLLEALQAAGRQADATAEARRYRAHMADVGLEPSAHFVEIEHRIFTSPPKAAGATKAASLPARLSSIVGRERDLGGIAELLRNRRLVTLVGPGGVGKTTLALEAGRAAAGRFPDGTYLATLADIDDPASVVPSILRAVGAPATEPLDRSLEDYLTGRRALLILDNAEHVHSAVRSVSRRLVAVASELRILTTSRRPLGTPGEVVVPVEPLDLEAATQLLRERARDAGADIAAEQEALAAEVCARLDRLPLAIEMAAARLRALGVENLAARLDERLRLLRSGEGDRYETLGEVVAWSFDLLDAARQSLLAQLSVFAGPFDLEAAEAVCSSADVVGGLGDLVDRSLLRVDFKGEHARYRLLETVQAFAGERLAESDASRSTVEAHVRHHVRTAERIGEGLRGPEEIAWIGVLEAQTANLEAAHGRALQMGDVDAAVRIAAAPYVAVYQRLRADLGAWAEATLPVARSTGHPWTPAVAAVVALNHLNRGDADRAAALLVDLPDDPVARHAHEVLGDLHVYRGELDVSIEHFRRAETLAREGADPFTAMYSRVSQAIALGYAGRVEAGLDLVERLRQEAAAARNPLIAAWCDYARGELLADTHPRQALQVLDRAVAAADQAGWRMLSGVGRLTASSLRARAAEPTDAIPGFERLIRHWERLGDQTHQWTTLRNLVDLFVRLGAHRPAARLLGAVSTASTPTFGPEEQRLAEASASVRTRIPEDAEGLITAGRADGLPAAVELALTTLADLRSGPVAASASHPGAEADR